MKNEEKFLARIGKVIEKSYRAKIKNKDGHTVGYFDVQLFGFAEDNKAQMSLERTLNFIEINLPK